MNKIVAIIIVAIFAFFSFNYSESSERIRFYKTDDGWAKATWKYADKQSDGSWRFYDKKGRYGGRMTKHRFYSKDGKVIEKLYLIPNNE